MAPLTLRPGSRRARLESTLARAWAQRGPLALALWPVAQLFGALAALRRMLYARGVLASTRLPVPVIVVGNIYVGGTGKTPLTIWLVEVLRAAGFSPGVISRGHGSAADTARVVAADSTPDQVGDEPLLIALRARCPVVVGRDRAQAGRALLAWNRQVDVLISDDGLQHYGLQRDIEIVLFDARGVGNGWLLPAGPLRESATRRRDFTLVNGPELSTTLRHAVRGAPVRMQLAGEIAFRLSDPTETIELAHLAKSGRSITAAAGIGNPRRFFDLLRAAGLRFFELALPDHHDFLDQPFTHVQTELILITEKDAVKCRHIENLANDARLWVVPVTAHIDATLAEQIVEKCRGCSTA